MTILDTLGFAHRRRTLRLVHPGLQLRLAVSVVAVTLGLAVLSAFNTWAAFGRLSSVTLSWAPDALRADIWAQAYSYLEVSLALFAASAAALAWICVAAVHRMVGPTVALERQVRAMARGIYSKRVVLRRGETLYAGLAQHLNELADRLEREQRQRTSYAGKRHTEREMRPAPKTPEIPLTARA